VGFILVKFVKTTLGAVATLKIAEILLRLGPNKTRLDTTKGNEQGFDIQRTVHRDIFL
jgi:hypothetical protein